VLNAVLAELVHHGYDSLTVDGVATRSGVHRTSIYRRWGDVGGLLADALQAANDDGWAPPDTGSLAGDLAAMNRQMQRALTVRPSITAAVIAASFRSPEAASALRAFFADRYRRGAEVVQRAVDRGELPPETDGYRLLVAATAPVYHHLVLLGDDLSVVQAEQYGRDAAAAAVRQLAPDH
jgi:AcrR family transcriptional regulator